MNSTWSQILKLLLRNSPLIVVSILLLIAGGLGYKFYKDSMKAREEIRRYEDLVGSREDYKQLTKYLAKLETDYVNQQILHEEAMKEWSNEREELKGKIKALADATFEGGSDDQDIVLGSDDLMGSFYTHFCCDNGKFGPAVAETKIDEIVIKDGSAEEMLLTTRVIKHEIQVKAAIAKDEESGQVSILTKAYWLQKEGRGEWLNIPYPLSITGGRLIIDPTEPVDITPVNKFRWAPHVNVGAFLAATSGEPEYGGHLNLSLWGYGRTKNDLDWKIGSVGLNFGSEYLDANLTPVSWRLGSSLPLVSDVWVAPGIGYGTSGTSYFLTLNTTL